MSHLQRKLPLGMRALPLKQQVAALVVDLHKRLLKAQENMHHSRSPTPPVPGTVEAMVEVLSTTTNTGSPELIAGVMATIPNTKQGRDAPKISTS